MDDRKLARLALVAPEPSLVDIYRAVFRDRPEVGVNEGSLSDRSEDAWVLPIDREGRVEPSADTALRTMLGDELSEELTSRVRRDGRVELGSALSFSTERAEPPTSLICTAWEGDTDHSETERMLLASAGALQAVHMHNRAATTAIHSVAMPCLPPQTGLDSDALVMAELVWTAYDLYLHAELQRFEDIPKALLFVYGGALRSAEPVDGSYKRSFADVVVGDAAKATVPDTPNAQANLRRRLMEAKRALSEDGDEG